MSHTMSRRKRATAAVRAARAALELIAQDDQLSVVDAVDRVVGRSRVNPETVRRQVYRQRIRCVRAAQEHHRRALSDLEEDGVAGYVLGFANWSSPLKPRRILQSVNSAFHKRLTMKWLAGFLKRHRLLLTKRQAHPIQTSRLVGSRPEDLRAWLDSHRRFLATRRFAPHARFNIDETRVVPKDDNTFVVGKQGHKHNVRQSRVVTLATLVPVIAADGSVFMTFYVLPSPDERQVRLQRIPDDKRTRPGWPRYYAATRTGYTNRAVWQEILRTFARRWKALYSGLDCVIYLDNCSSHGFDRSESADDVFLLKLSQKGIHCFFLPANTTAWLQPLDDVAFGLFKLAVGRQHQDACFDAAVTLDTDAALDLKDVAVAEQAAFTPATIKRCWLNTGMSSKDDASQIDEEKVIQLARRAFAEPDKPTNSAVSAAQRLTLATLSAQTGRRPAPASRVSMRMNAIYSPDELRDALVDEQSRKAKKEEERRLQAIQREERRKEEKEKRAKQTRKAARRKKWAAQLLQSRKRAAREQAKDAEAERNRCAACGRQWRGGADWLECETCPDVSVCGRCSEGRAFMEAHEAMCRGTVTKSRRKK